MIYTIGKALLSRMASQSDRVVITRAKYQRLMSDASWSLSQVVRLDVAERDRDAARAEAAEAKRELEICRENYETALDQWVQWQDRANALRARLRALLDGHHTSAAEATVGASASKRITRPKAEEE